VPFVRTLEDGSNSLDNKWRVKLLKYNPLQSAIRQYLKDEDEEGYKLDAKSGFIVVSSLGALYHRTERSFYEILNTGSKKVSKTVCNKWMEKFVVEALKCSFNLWIKACPNTLGMLDPHETISVL
jgi:hypothetical protein